jgi:hypothetical protein
MDTRCSSLGAKRPGREADHSPPSSAEVKECVELHLHSPNTPSWRGAQFEKKKHRNNFTFCFTSISFPQACYISWQSPPPSFDHPNNIWCAPNYDTSVCLHGGKAKLLVKLSPCFTFKYHDMKTCPVLNWAPGCEVAWGSGGIAPRILNLGTRWRWVVIFTPRLLIPRYSLDRGVGGPQNRSGHGPSHLHGCKDPWIPSPLDQVGRSVSRPTW